MNVAFVVVRSVLFNLRENRSVVIPYLVTITHIVSGNINKYVPSKTTAMLIYYDAKNMMKKI